ncbi:uncharacterized protein BO96DRAFT_432067 [Aspergillus niger CBS 101883]|uniref:uncharacterized protein n=1 Tax=Aspergillus lacticoffeatus (strain CBS 101883) TaxID=1450533 RepID=UPI000D7FAB6B|nr:uncharacterized protein BO96DRAFT_432067 [Aspergillus niger CBS 101883]PYH58980.1 hypothetical protein BO96DRAFT_432067 [Aspergillus niger CBS 101883]
MSRCKEPGKAARRERTGPKNAHLQHRANLRKMNLSLRTPFYPDTVRCKVMRRLGMGMTTHGLERHHPGNLRDKKISEELRYPTKARCWIIRMFPAINLQVGTARYKDEITNDEPRMNRVKVLRMQFCRIARNFVAASARMNAHSLVGKRNHRLGDDLDQRKLVEAVSSTFELDDAETPWLGSDKVTSSRAPGKAVAAGATALVLFGLQKRHPLQILCNRTLDVVTSSCTLEYSKSLAYYCFAYGGTILSSNSIVIDYYFRAMTRKFSGYCVHGNLEVEVHHMASLSSFDRRVNNPRCSFSTNGCLCPSLRPSARVTKRPKDSHQPQFSHLDSGCRMGLEVKVGVGGLIEDGGRTVGI